MSVGVNGREGERAEDVFNNRRLHVYRVRAVVVVSTPCAPQGRRCQGGASRRYRPEASGKIDYRD